MIIYFLILFYISYQTRNLNISIDSTSLNIILYSLPHLLPTIKRTNVFFKNIGHFMVFKLSIFIVNNTTDFYYFNLFRICRKYFYLILCDMVKHKLRVTSCEL